MHQRRAIDWIGLALLLPPPLFWAGNFLVGRLLRDSVPPFTLLFWRWVIALVVLAPFAWRLMRRDRALYWAHRWRLVRVALAGIVAFNSFIYIGLHSTTASNGLLLNSLIPILILLFGAAFFGERLQAVQVAGVALSFVGVLVIIARGEVARVLGLSFSHGDLIVFCAMICWAFYTLWLRGSPPEIDRVGLIAAQIVIGLVFLFPLMQWERLFGPAPVWSATALKGVAFLGVFPSVAALLLYNLAVARLGPARTGLSIHLIPVFGVVLAVLFLGETLHPYHAAGIVAIAAGISLALRKPCTRPRPRPGEGKTWSQR